MMIKIGFKPSILALSIATVLLGGCGDDGTDGVAGTDGKDGQDLIEAVGIRATEVQFAAIDVPLTSATQSSLQHSERVTFGDETQAVSYTQLLATGDVNNGETFGQVKDYQDRPLTFADGSPYVCNGTNSGQGSGLDFSSILQKNNKLYMVNQFECAIGAMYMVELEQTPATGALTVKPDTLEFISQKDEFGGFVHCAGQTTPWQSHLGSEEYEPDARKIAANADPDTGLTGDSYYDELRLYWDGDIRNVSPYYYGWTPEVTLDNDGNATYTKHYAMGRFSHEIGYVMPDRKTVYLSDDGTNVGLFMFIADAAADLSAGKLYAAKWQQTSDVAGGRATLSWIPLGESDNAAIKALLNPDSDVNTNDAITFADIFLTVDPAIDGSCSTGYTSINTSAGHECLQLRVGDDRSDALADDEAVKRAAAFLETRRYAAMLGATTEFRKEEGITFDSDHNRLYVAMSEIAKGMENNSSSDTGGPNHIQLEKNSCGAIYGLDVAASRVTDSAGDAIDSAYVVNNMYAMVTGSSANYPDDSPYAGNGCAVDGIANPDNITYLDGSNLLFIGEDTGNHLNNMIWAYDVENGALDRILTTPLDAETTSPFWYRNINGFGYMTVVTQHPMESQESTADDKESKVGVLGPIRNLDSVSDVTLHRVGRFDSGDGEAGSEISAFDPVTKRLFITNGATNQVDVVDISQVAAPNRLSSLVLSSYGATVQSVAVKNGQLAVAIGSNDKTGTKGRVAIFNTSTLALTSQTEVGYLPDMVTFNSDGSKVIVANEAEPAAAEPYTGDDSYRDQPGTIGMIVVADATPTANRDGYSEVGFTDAVLTDAADGTPVRLGGTPRNNKEFDLEPEYITISGDYAYVTLQENNAVAKVDISAASPVLEGVISLGAKAYDSASGNRIDIEEDGEIRLQHYPELYGLYMPDTIASYSYGGQTFLVTANEGDGREWIDSNEDGFVDEIKIKDLPLAASIDAAYTNDNDLKVVKDMGGVDTDGDGVYDRYDKLYTYGARSFTIWNSSGALVWDSGDQFSVQTASHEPALFNQDEGVMDGRSGNKGVEPEALAIGQVNGKTYAFIGFERQSAIVTYDISNPYDPHYVSYMPTHTDNDVSPEGMLFIPAYQSPNGRDLLVVSYEMSGSTVIYEIKP